MAVKRMGSEGPKVSRVTSNSPRMAARRRTTARAQARTRQQMLRKPTTVTESGVGNIPMTIARGVSALIGRATAQGAKTAVRKPSAVGGTSRGVSKVTGGALKRGKPAKYGPANKKLTPQQRAAQTRAMNKAKAKYAAEGPKKSVAKKAVASKPVKTGLSTKKKVIAGTAAGATGVVAYGAMKKGKEGPKRNTRTPKDAVWNGNTWIKKK